VPDILIYDDDPTARFLLKKILVRELDATVTEATDGLQALRLLTARRFDALILDLRMPVMDGPETLEVVRNTPDLREIPVVVLSGVNRVEFQCDGMPLVVSIIARTS
jgi:CheY-like chemotaxis protein